MLRRSFWAGILGGSEQPCWVAAPCMTLRGADIWAEEQSRAAFGEKIQQSSPIPGFGRVSKVRSNDVVDANMDLARKGHAM